MRSKQFYQLINFLTIGCYNTTFTVVIDLSGCRENIEISGENKSQFYRLIIIKYSAQVHGKHLQVYDIYISSLYEQSYMHLKDILRYTLQ